MRTPAAEAHFEELIKRSRFLARAGRADDPAAALAWIERHSDRAATHNCWAYRIGSAYRFSDDGEPGGTAGRPILAAIEGSGIDHVAVLVTRWYGGVKLGAGGLARAYGGSAARCLNRTAVTVEVPQRRVRLLVPFDELGTVHLLAARFGASKTEEEFLTAGVRMVLSLAEDAVELLLAALEDQSRGRITAETGEA